MTGPKWEPNEAQRAAAEAKAAAVKAAHKGGGGICKTCVSPYAAAVNAALMEGIGANTIAARFSLPLQSIKRHRTAGHHNRSIRALAALTPKAKAIVLGEQAAVNAANLIAKSANLMERAEKFLDMAEASGDMNSMGKALNAVERSIRLACELAGAFPQKNGPSIDARHVTINSLGGLSTEDLKALIALPALDDDGD